ncbi:MAG: LuxR C-terminal-related transcriptional regulator [Candidatus Gastranaerophilales bacterium]|nr:LuxR C-terminal-related transcriptional regulator [Candidatus Gastranaerophilales bacterium]
MGNFKNNILTERQQEVLCLLVEGLYNSEIAERLIITEHTVKAHVCAIYEVLGVTCRVQAAVAAIKLGLATTDSYTYVSPDER